MGNCLAGPKAAILRRENARLRAELSKAKAQAGIPPTPGLGPDHRNPKKTHKGKPEVVVIVDPYSSGQYLVQEFERQLWPMVGVQSSQELAGFWLAQFDEGQFAASVQHKDLKSTLKQLQEFKVVAVLPGSEPGVELAEELTGALGLPGNDPKTTRCRRHKYHMQERLREMNVRAIRQTFSNDVDEILKWQAQWGRWPVVIKPAESGGTDGVYMCFNEADVRSAVGKELGVLNCNGVVNDKLLVQEYLDGDEYIVNTVSYEGEHVISGILVYQKRKDPATKSITWENTRFLEPHGKIQDQLVEYTFRCLNALGIRHGAAHSEIMMTADGPCMVETGARMHGLKGPKITELATGLGTHELLVDIAVNEARVFKAILKQNYRYVLKKFSFETGLLNFGPDGILAEPIDVQRIRSLPSVVDVKETVKVGQYMPTTRDLATVVGVITQVFPTLEQCLADIAQIRKWEAEGFYVLEKPKPAAPAALAPPKGPSPKCSPMYAANHPVPFQLSPKPSFLPAGEVGELKLHLDSMEDLPEATI